MWYSNLLHKYVSSMQYNIKLKFCMTVLFSYIPHCCQDYREYPVQPPCRHPRSLTAPDAGNWPMSGNPWQRARWGSAAILTCPDTTHCSGSKDETPSRWMDSCFVFRATFVKRDRKKGVGRQSLSVTFDPGHFFILQQVRTTLLFMSSSVI